MSRSFQLPVVLLALASLPLASAATFQAQSTSCNSDSSNLSTAALPASNGHTGVKLYGDCTLFWESSLEGGETAVLTASMSGTIDSDPGGSLIPMAWKFSIFESIEGGLPADSYDWEVWALDDGNSRVILGSGVAAPDEVISGSAPLSFAGLLTWNYGVTITAHLPSGAFGSFLLDIPQDSLDLNAPTRTTGDVPEPGSALLVLAGGAGLLLLRRR